MRYHQPIIDARRRGYRPAGMVTLTDIPALATPVPEVSPDWVLIEPVDAAARADLRFVVGLQVSLQFSDEPRMREFFEACRMAGAKTVTGCAGRDWLAEEPRIECMLHWSGGDVAELVR